MQAYKGTAVNGFPNFFFVVGPNTGLGHSSMVFMIESHVAYIIDAISHLKTHGVVSAEPKAEAQASFVDDLQTRMRRTVWSTGGCASWYLDDHGRNVTLWPRATFTFRRLLRAFDATTTSWSAATTCASTASPQHAHPDDPQVAVIQEEVIA